MSLSLLEQLPDIVKRGRRQAEQILESLETKHRVGLQTREFVVPAKDAAGRDWLRDESRARATLAGEMPLVNTAQSQQELAAFSASPEWRNRMVYGDNLLVMAALLAGDEHTPSLRGKIDLIYIDPPFDSKADYRTKITLPGCELDQKPTVLEQHAYADTWKDGTASYLEMIVPRLCLMKELLSDRGSIYVHLDWHVGHYVKIAMDEVFGKENFKNQITWVKNSLGAKSRATQFPRNQDMLMFFSKTSEYHFVPQIKEQVSYIDFSNGKEKLPAGIKCDQAGRYYWTSPKGDYTDESIRQLEVEGRIERTGTGTVRIKYFLKRDGMRLIKDAVLDDAGMTSRWYSVALILGQTMTLRSRKNFSNG